MHKLAPLYITTNWKGYYKKRDNKKGKLRRKADLKMLIMIDQVNHYEESNNCKRAKEVFKELKENLRKYVSQKDFVACGDHILPQSISPVLIDLELQPI